MPEPLVSIIIPTFNRAHLIGETLDSVLTQTYTNWECIVVDDGSSDNTAEILNQYISKDSRFQFHKRPDNYPKGGNGARNYGFELSKGEYINWFDSDDLMVENKIEFQLSKLKCSILPFIVCQTLVFEGTKENILGLRKMDIHSDDFFNDFITNKIKWLTQAPLFKRNFVIDNNLTFDKDLMQSQERDFFVKTLSLVDDYLFDDTPLVFFRRHEQSISHGKTTRLKLNSNFIVNYRILINYKSRLSKSSIKYLKKALKSDLRISLRKKELKLANKFYFLIQSKEVDLTFYEKIKVFIGVMSFKFLNKGDIFFK